MAQPARPEGKRAFMAQTQIVLRVLPGQMQLRTRLAIVRKMQWPECIAAAAAALMTATAATAELMHMEQLARPAAKMASMAQTGAVSHALQRKKQLRIPQAAAAVQTEYRGFIAAASVFRRDAAGIGIASEAIMQETSILTLMGASL